MFCISAAAALYTAGLEPCREVTSVIIALPCVAEEACVFGFVLIVVCSTFVNVLTSATVAGSFAIKAGEERRACRVFVKAVDAPT